MSHRLYDPTLAKHVAQDCRQRWQLDDALMAYDDLAFRGAEDDRPVLHLEDVTGIPFVDGVPGVEEYQHRARVRATDGDLFAAGTRPAEGYEDYNQQHLQLGDTRFIYASHPDDPRAVARACAQTDAFSTLCDVATDRGGLLIHPYMAIDTVWQLARKLHRHTDQPISVLGPPTPALWVANDKSHLSHVVSEALSPDWLVQTKRSSDPDTLTDELASMARRCDHVGLKRTRCASAMGNAVFDASEIRQQSRDQLRHQVDHFLERTRWTPDEDVLVVEWRPTDISPSTQLWIPPIDQGEPRLEGVYEQLLEGPEKVFLGSQPSTLPDAVNHAIAQASLQVSAVFQALGYVGRCSFDFIITGDLHGDFQAAFTECNGRWGGTSTPMHLVDRLLDFPESRPDYIATDYYLPDSHAAMTFGDLRQALDEHLFDPLTGDGRFVLYNVGPLSECAKFDIISFGDDPEDARHGLQHILPSTLGFDPPA